MATTKTNIWIDGSQAGATLGELKKKVAILNREIKDLPRNSDAYNKKVKELGQANQALTTHRNQIKGVSDAYGPANSGISSLLKQVAPLALGFGLVTKVTGGIVNGIKSWVNNNIVLSKSLSSLQSLTGATGEDLKFYKEEAISMGKESIFSASQVVEAMKLIGSAKPELLKNKNALAEVTKETLILAEASEMDLAAAANALTGTLNQFNKTGKDSKQVINVLAAGSKAGAADIQSLADATDKVGAVSEGYNVTIEENVGLLETMAEKNIKGAEAGTKLRNVLLTMQGIKALPENAKQQLEEYGVNVELVSDKTKPLNERLAEMAKISGDATAMMEVFGKENTVAAASILGNTDKVKSFTEAVTGTNTAYEQAAINTNNLDGDLKSLSSAWEGLTLAFDGSEGVFRPIVQAGTDMLNWISDTVTAIKDFDGTKLETQFLKIGRNIPFLSDEMENLFDQQIRMNEITGEVIDTIQDEAESVAVLIKSIDANNKKLKEANITEEEAAKIKDENAKFIGVLNEKYPELTENIDLNKASSDELNKVQQQINQNLIDQAVNAAMARESERLLGEMIQNTISAERARNDENKLKKKSPYALWLADLNGLRESSDDFDKKSKINEQNLRNLGNVSEQVKEQISGANLNFGAAFDENKKVAEDALKQMDLLVKALEKTSSAGDRKIIEGKIAAQQSLLNTSNKYLDESQKKALQLLTEQTSTEQQLSIESQKAAEKAASNYKKLQDQLGDLIKKTEEFQKNFDYSEKLNSFKDEQAKELFELENSIEAKYQKEIESAQELASKKGDIGKKAQETLNALLVLKEEDLTAEKLKINEKYAKEKRDAELTSEQEANLQFLAQQESLEEAKIKLKVLKAQIAYDNAKQFDKQQQDVALVDLNAALDDQFALEDKRKLEHLMDQFANDEISREEYNLRKEELELEHQDRIKEIVKQSDEEMLAESIQRQEQAINTIAQVVGIINDFANVELEKRINLIDKEKKSQLDALEEKKRKGLVTEQEFNDGVQNIEDEHEAKRKQIENEKAKKDKEMAIFNAIIATALGVIKASPVVPLMVLAGIAGAAQVALISSKPVPQYADGGYATVQGASDGKYYNAKNIGRPKAGMTPSNPSLALISEKGPEYFVPNALLRNQEVMNHVGAIEAIRTNQFADGGYTSDAAQSDSANLTKVLQMNLVVMSALNNKIPYITAQVGDKQLDDMNSRNAELSELRN